MEDEYENINCVRIIADLGVFDNPKNHLTNTPIYFRSGDSVRFDIVLFNNKKITDCSNIVSASFEIMDIGEINSPLPRVCKTLFKRTVFSDKINNVLTDEDISFGKCHFSIVMTSEESLVGEGNKYLKIYTYDNSGNRITFASGWIYVAPNFSATLTDSNPNEVNWVEHLENVINVQAGRIDAICNNVEILDSNKVDRIELLPHLEMWQFLYTSKANNGALHFNGGGYAQCPKLLRNQPFSFAVRIKANKNDVLIKKQVNIIDMGVFYLYIHSSVQRLSVYATGTGNSLQSVTTEQNNRIFDGNWHSLFVTYDGTTLTLSDEYGVLLTVNYSIQEQTSGTKFGSNFVGQMQDICVFNFDMSADNAPYTIADYQNGKAIPPKAFYGQDCFVGGIEQSYSWLRTGLTMTSNITFDENGTNFIFDNTNGTSADYQVAVFNVNIPKGANVSIEGDWASIYAVYLYYGSVTPIQLIDNGEIIKNHVTNTENCTALRIRPLSTGAGSTRTITLPPSCKIKVNGSILALEDYTITNGTTQMIFDYSGNNNDATVTGIVKGDNDNRIAKLIDFIKA